MKTLSILLSMTFLASTSAYAKKTPSDAEAKKVQAHVLAACKKEFPKETKGKAFKEVFAWIETEERGTNKETFEKTKCYAAHEEWEKLSGEDNDEKNEGNEGAEHHE